jgi:enterochelin esterase family protein
MAAGTGGQSELARRLGWDGSTIRRKLSGKTKFTKADAPAVRVVNSTVYPALLLATTRPVAYPGQAALVPSPQPQPTGGRGRVARSVVRESGLPGSFRMRKAITYAVGLGCAWVAVMAIAQAMGQQPPSPAPNPDSHYRLGPDSLPQEGVPKGEIRGPYTLPSQVYPGTQHTYWVYVPAQYDPAVPAALMVFQDGQAFKDENGDMRAQNVMDNLIYRREIPIMIGVFINPGRRPDQPEPTPKNWGDRDTNRPTEYNSLDDRYARVISEELMPKLAKDYNISKDPEMHGIGGSSSGAIAAFTVAWERPDHFRKVLSNVGSFVNLRGGHVYPEKVLAIEKKLIRLYLCDGRNDNRGLRNGRYDETRDWFFQNVRLMKALTRKGYDVNYAWGMNNHGQKFGGAILPEMMRWLWRDGPVSTDPRDEVERGFRQPAAREDQGADRRAGR